MYAFIYSYMYIHKYLNICTYVKIEEETLIKHGKPLHDNINFYKFIM